ncbi:hypothetical protein ARMGADRAFT_1036581 [Armillaria gallica]|uniref:Uncharacterized protein n=1 Tax=Armillaria gallica TaxID=47427 RepID=A0A2H3CT74_ARMGA|nr:hypothetical protein ARMGADRAFT_1036581 [Armillaria gallica]
MQYEINLIWQCSIYLPSYSHPKYFITSNRHPCSSIQKSMVKCFIMPEGHVEYKTMRAGWTSSKLCQVLPQNNVSWISPYIEEFVYFLSLYMKKVVKILNDGITEIFLKWIPIIVAVALLEVIGEQVIIISNGSGLTVYKMSGKGLVVFVSDLIDNFKALFSLFWFLFLVVEVLHFEG